MLVAGICGIAEVDLKKVIALSTLRQLGLMIILLGNNCADICFFHLIIHALFKSSLFIRIGCKIHEYTNIQDNRVLMVSWKNPLLGFRFRLTNLSLIGFPFISGFYSKDLGLEFCLRNHFSFLWYFIIILRVILTLGYRLKFLMVSRVDKDFFYPACTVRVLRKTCVKSLFFLLFIRVVFGYLYYKLFFNSYCVSYIFRLQKILIPVGLFFSFFLLIKKIFFFKNKIKSFFLFNFFITLFYLREITTFGKNLCTFSLKVFKNLDRGWLEGTRAGFLVLYLNKSFFYLTQKILFNNFRIIFILLIFYFSFLR